MDLREAMKEQYHAGLAMLSECVAKCPESVWLEGKNPRAFWRIACHTVYFTHNYHELTNLRHLQGHVGQLSELLMARGIDIAWIARSGNPGL